MDITELYAKPLSYKFNKKELDFIKSKNPKHRYLVKYAIYKIKSIKGVYIGFFIDYAPQSVRRSGIYNHWDFISERSLTNIEYQEVIENFGANNRRFWIYHYRYIEELIREDLKYNVKTPDVFVKKCKELGYSGGVQIKINFN